MITSKLKESITDTLKRIEDDSFDERDIKTLLIDIREYIRDQSILRELANFIAHPIRDKGICHKLLNARYTKLVLITEQQAKTSEGIKNGTIKTEAEYSAAMLSSISVDRIDRTLFNISFIDGIEDVDEKDLIKFYSLKRSQAVQLIRSSYFLDNGEYVLKNFSQKSFLNDLFKFVRGTLSGKPAFDQKAFVSELKQALSIVTNTFALDRKYLGFVSKNATDILVCILCLLHDARLTLYDKSEGRFFLTVRNGNLAIGTTGTAFTFLLTESDIPASELIKEEHNRDDLEGHAIPFVKAIRNKEKTLELVKLES